MTNSIRKSKNRVYRDSQRRGPCYPPVLTLIAVCILVSGASGAVFGPLGDPAFNDNQGSATTKSQSPLAAWGVDYLLACGARPDGVDQTNYDVLMYDIFLKIPKGDPDYIIGRVTCIAEITTDNTGIIAFDFAEEQIMQIDAIYSPDGPLGYNRVGEVIFVALDGIHQAGDTVEITTEYRGEPAECGLQGFRHENSWRTNSLSCTSSLSQPSSARSWWPCKDRPDDKADSFKIAIQVPTDEENNRIPISNGRHDGVFDTANTATYVFTVTHPMATYLFGVAIYPYQHVWQKPWVYNDERDTMPVYFYAFDYDRDIEAAWNLVPSMLDWMSDWFGLYPFRNEKYGHAHFQPNFAMEHQTISFFPRYGPSHTDIVDTGKIVHELAHQWWGNMITCASWHHSWLNEGWAKWAEALWLEKTVDAGKYRDFMADLKCFDTTRSVYVEDTTWIIADVFYEPLVYNKGAWVIHMLRHKLGDSLFRQGIKEYYDFGIEGVSATTEDMRDVFALATDMDLVPFFQQWIYDTGYPVYEWYYTYQPDLENDPLHERVVQFHVEQMDEKGLQRFEMPVDFEFNYKGGGSDTFTFNVDSIDNFYAVSVPDSIESIVVDPGGWVLHEARKMRDWRQEAILTRTNSTDPTIALSKGIVDSTYEDTIYTTVGVDSCDFTLVMDNGEPENFLFDDTMGIISITMCVDTGTWDFTVTAKRKSDGSVIDMATLSLVIEPALSLPEHFVLHANYPNPFNPSTLIEFDLPRSAHVSIDIYNVLGQKVRSLINREYPAGFGHTVEWKGDNNSGRPVATGVYFYRMESEGWVQSRKMLLLR